MLTADRRPLLFVVLTLALMIGGLIADPPVSTLLFALAYLFGGYDGAIASFSALRRGAVEIDLLMILAALGAAAVGSPFEGAMLLFLFSLSNVLQSYAIGKSRDAIRALMELRPTQALRKRNGELELLPIDQIRVGDLIVLRPGERIPLDSIVREGESACDESSLTGESLPITKRPGASVFAGTINQSGGLEVEVVKLAKDSTIAKLIQLVEQAQSEKAETQRFLDRAERFYAFGVIVFTLGLIAVGWLILAEPFDQAFYRAMTAMVVASPCALVISTPASILSAIANGARRGVLFKGGAHLERTADLKIVAFDKTGTLTEGRPQVTDVTVIPLFDEDHRDLLMGRPTSYRTTTREAARHEPSDEEKTLLLLAAAVEAKSEHPLAQAIVKKAKEHGLDLPGVSHFQSTTGRGVRAHVDFGTGFDIVVGSPRIFEGLAVEGHDEALKEVTRLQDEGKTSVIVARAESGSDDLTVLGVIAIADVLRQAAASIPEALRSVGIEKIVMLTGDNARVARSIAAQARVEDYFADLLPQDKVDRIKSLGAGGEGVAMVGDGVNDAPALASASVGIAMGAAGSDVALETADIVLMANDLTRIPYAIALAKKARRVVYQNLIFSASVIVVLLVATLALEPLGYRMPLPLGVVGHEGSTVLVCLNGLRLLGFDWRPPG